MVMLALPLHTCTSGPVALRAMCLRGDDRHQLLLNNVFGYIGNLRNWLPWMAATPDLLYMAVSLGALDGWSSGADRVQNKPVKFCCVLELSFTMNDSGPSASAVICSRMDRDPLWRCRLRRSRRKSRNQQPDAAVLCATSGALRMSFVRGSNS
jgi:hypothetical protein